MSYTKGPWREKDGVVYSSNNEYIFRPDFSTMGVMPSERKGNAMLISAAPELLQACQMLIRYVGLRESKGADTPSEVVFANKIIAKALGDS